MKRKGFTLIELLAVIVILAIIMVIAVPQILNAIENSRKSAAVSSAQLYIRAIEYNNKFADMKPTEYTKITSGDVSGINVSIKGEGPTSGSVTINENGKVSSASLCIQGYTVNYNGTSATAIDKCDSTPQPVTTNSIDMTSENILTTTVHTARIYSMVSDGIVRMGMWETNLKANAYYKDKIVVTASRPATITGKVSLWYNCSSNAKYRIGFSKTTDSDETSFDEYQEFNQNFYNPNDGLSSAQYEPYGQDFEVTITEPGEYYVKAVYYMTNIGCSSYSSLYELNITQ